MIQTNTQAALRIAVVDDHRLFRSGLINLIHSLGPRFSVVAEAGNGQEFLHWLQTHKLPDIAIVDVNMPGMNGMETATTLKEKYPAINVLVLTMVENEATMMKMLQTGIKGYLSKDVEPGELKLALESIAGKGFYYTDYVTGKLIDAMNQPGPASDKKALLTEREMEFLQHACSELTYKEIADIMCLSVKTVDGYRNNLFEKLDVKSRTGLAIYAIKHGLIKL